MVCLGDGLLMSSRASLNAAMIDAAMTTVEAKRSESDREETGQPSSARKEIFQAREVFVME
jgi:hypothetical protein